MLMPAAAATNIDFDMKTVAVVCRKKVTIAAAIEEAEAEELAGEGDSLLLSSA